VAFVTNIRYGVQFYKSRIILWQLLPWLLWGVWTMENEGRKRSTSPHRGRRTICLYLLNLGAPPGGWGGWLDNQKYFQVLRGACYFNPTNWEREKVLHSTAVFWLLLKVESIQILWKSRQKTFSKDIYLNSVLYWQEYSLFCKILNSINSHKLQVDGLWIRLQTKCKRLLTRDCWTNKSCCWLWQLIVEQRIAEEKCWQRPALDFFFDACVWRTSWSRVMTFSNSLWGKRWKRGWNHRKLSNRKNHDLIEDALSK